MAHGDIAWNELATSNVEAVKGFYGDLLGWKAKGWPMPDGGTYWVWQHADADPDADPGTVGLGGAFQMEGPHFAGQQPHWAVYMTVDDCDAACAKVGALGGKVVQPPFDVPEVGRIAMVADPSGAVFGIMTPVTAANTAGD